MRVVLRNRESSDGCVIRSLTVGRAYEVLGIEADSYRLITEAGEPVLFDPACFAVDDPREPDFWLSRTGDEGERYAYPPAWGEPGFFEDWHDGVEAVRQAFAEGLAHWYPRATEHR